MPLSNLAYESARAAADVKRARRERRADRIVALAKRIALVALFSIGAAALIVGSILAVDGLLHHFKWWGR